jgi:hypothetical protein
MKFILVLHLCSMLTGKCFDSSYPSYQFKTHYDCAIAGYAFSQESLKLLAQEEYYYGLDRINKERLAIRFECRELKAA